MSPLYSIIIPIYNSGSLIENAIKSLDDLLTKRKDFEIIFVDDGSNKDDLSLKIVDDYLKKTPSARCIHKKNEGCGTARNYGVKEASGEWVVFLDSDDYLQPDSFEVFENILSKEQTDVVLFGFREVNDEQLFSSSVLDSKYSIYNNVDINKAFLKRTIVPLLPGTFFRRKFLIDNNLWQQNVKWSEDQLFMWSVFNVVEKVVVSNYVNYNYLQNVSSSIMGSTNVDRMLTTIDYFSDLTKRMKNQKIAPFVLPRWLLGCAHSLAKRSDYLDFVSFLEKTNYKKWLRKLLSFPSFKTRIISFVGLLSKKVFYKLMGR